MQSFNELLAEYLDLYGDYVRSNGQDIEFRGIQRHLHSLARIIEVENIGALAFKMEELKEDYDPS